LKPSDVVFMYEAPKSIYEDYGATVLAWGGTPKPKSLEAARGLKFLGSVGMVTEFARYYDRFPRTYEQGLCRDLEGKPFKVPWLTDHQYKGVPYWWCCTRQPLFRQYLSERVVETVKAGAAGLHIDDHLGSAGPLWMGGCFCDRCVEEFRDYLKTLPADQLAGWGIADPRTYNYREVLRAWLAEKPGRKVDQHPLWRQWRIYQLRGAAAFMAKLRAVAARAAGHPVPMSANACLLWGPHLNDYQSLAFFSAEIDHHASARKFSDAPLFAYRLADAVGRPLAATASGGDWAFVKENNVPGLVQGWIALSYAAGNYLMAPNRQWCYTPEKGTHWYEGPKEKFAPLYQFVRRHADLFDGYRTFADLTLVVSERTYDRDSGKVIGTAERLAAANLSFAVALGGDEVVQHPLPATELRRSSRLLVLEPKDFSPTDRQLLERIEAARRYDTVETALTSTSPAARLEPTAPVRVLPRVKPGSVVVHLVNWDYDPERDDVKPIKAAKLILNLRELGVAGATEARWFAPGTEPKTLAIKDGAVSLTDLGHWAVIEIRKP